MSLSKSLLIEQLAAKRKQIALKDVESAVKIILDAMVDTLDQGRRVEVRGFGSFSLHYHKPRTGRNPKTGDPVELKGKYVPHFKPGKEMRERVNASMAEFPLRDS
ncbi:MAG: integration host factor subunit beta [Pseudomonadota bacterium]|nr:integration host factor subunit beta [Gammaproteobacteria bacterium]MEC8010990.1 integration host factor subunit beta [Pseudomonadota bacterium]HBF07658.1 integration host factor subunit beta [Gammaproteobacteria bacterium]|tara:strand:- start:292 stop:606 length:315 start_codon:yes stop_codon:yes gene_type:complete